MNWLAHVLLSEPSPRFRLGNILPDILGMSALAPLAGDFQRGIACHHAIDAFTDEHPVFLRSRRRFGPDLRRFSGILVDVFYDHVLAGQWSEHAIVPLPDLVETFYAGVGTVRAEVPAVVHPLLDHLQRDDWLGANVWLDGPRGALRRVERRLSHRVDLSGAVEVFVRERAGHEDDFREFFPHLVARVRDLGIRPPVSASGAAIPRSATESPLR